MIVEIANNGRNYQKVYESESEDNAVYFMVNNVDNIKPNDSMRLVREDGTVMVRKTPNSLFIHKDWK